MNKMTHKIYRVGVIGHRKLSGEEEYSYVHLCCHKILAGIKNKYPEVIAISAISEGADSIFAKSALSLDIKLESIIPYSKFKLDFQTDVNYETYRAIREKSKYETKINFSKKSNLAYKKSMEWLVFKSNTIIAIWDGVEAGSTGGTWESVLLCKKLKKPMIHINCLTNKISVYVNRGNSYSEHMDLSAQNIIRYI